MKRLTQVLPLLLAAALQLMPLLRNLVTSPAAGSSFAFILRWGVGTAATVGAFDACSGASGTVMNTSSNITGTVGTAMNVTNNFVINGGNQATPDDYITLSSKNGTIVSPNLTNTMTTTVMMPPGLTYKCYSINNANNIYGVITGTPTVATATNISLSAVYAQGGYVYTTNILITITGSSSTAPVITNNPASLTVDTGTNVTFSVTNGGTAPFKYQWYFNTNTALLNMTNAWLTLTNVQLTNSGYYYVAITNTAGSTNSLNALLTVLQPPVITNNPANATNMAGGSTTLTVLAGGSAPMKFQWYFNTNTALLNATNAALPLTGVRASQSGIYFVVVTNNGGSLTSAPAKLVITNPLPANITAATKSASLFQFTFIPVVGLTNSVLTNSALFGGTWGVLTNVPPPASAAPITISDPVGGPNRFYRVQINP
jgi:hypothetical protein